MLQWFETRWSDMERRMPDAFMSGYGATWLPPVSKSRSANSVGYDPYERFDLGSPSSPTAYGTESAFRAVVGEFKAANILVYVDSVLNHNSSRDGSTFFQQEGGWPGFWMSPQNPMRVKLPTDNWGDFHAGTAAGYLQSTNPNDPNYDVLRGDLVALIDIAHESNHRFIRHPVAAGDPRNIPAGTVANRPNAANARWYTDQALPGRAVVNPGTARAPGVSNFTFHPFNLADPMAGDPVEENGTGLLMRWTQYMLDVYQIDGFRIDAIKHVPSWFWDTYFDAVVYQRRTLADGRVVTPFSFGECVDGNSFTVSNYVRKDSFGNRDALDLNGAGALRDMVAVRNFATWQTVLNSHLDNADDSDNNGSVGVNHVYSHDNGTVGDGGSRPRNPSVREMGYFANAYLLMRPGITKIFHNGAGITRPGGFWPRQGVSTALGLNPEANTTDPTIPRMVALHNMVARGAWSVLNSTDPVNQSLDDVVIFERRTDTNGGNNGPWSGNCLVAVSDRYDTGVDVRSVQTSFGSNARLIELTGNAADPVVDPTNLIQDVLTTDGSGRVLITVPRNRSGATEHCKGFVVYAPAIPSGTLSFSGITSTMPADPAGRPSASRRLNPIPVISTPTFELSLTTTNGDPGAGSNANADDNAVFRFNRGFVDLNANGIVDIDGLSTVAPGYEQFVTERRPLAGTANATGLYRQLIDASRLPEGFNYVSVLAFRKRSAGEAPLFREFRQVVYIDRVGPAAEFVDPITTTASTSATFNMRALDRTATRMHLMLNLSPGSDPVALSTAFNQAARTDRFDHNASVNGLEHGWNTVTLTAFEESGRAAIYTHTFFADLCDADFNNDGFVDFFDFDDFATAFEAGDVSADYNNDGFIDFFDFDDFVASFQAGC